MVSETQPPPPHTGIEVWERGVDPWHEDAFPSEFKHAGTKGKRRTGWYGIDWCGNVVAWVPDTEEENGQ